jgi:hypothetical protein
MEMLKVVAFSNVVDLLKVMSLTLHTCYELKSLNFEVITIEFVNCPPTKFNGDIIWASYYPSSIGTI